MSSRQQMHIKHPPPKTSSNAIYISSKTPFVSGVKRIARSVLRMQRKRTGRYLVVIGLGRAIDRTLALAMELKEQRYKVEIRTCTLHALDETLDELGSEVKKRPVGGVELRVWPVEV